jgi:hypothetical protein
MTDSENMSDDNLSCTYTYDESYNDNSYNPKNSNKKEELKKELKNEDYDNKIEIKQTVKQEIKQEKPKKPVNHKATLDGIIERQKKVSQIKEIHKKKINEKLSGGMYLLYNTFKLQNTKLLKEVQEQFEENLPFECDLESDFIKPSYIVPKIVSHRLERHLNKIL